jgi:pentatricopeptide repeat protein
MLKFFSIAKPFNTARSIPLLLTIRVNTGVNIRNRAYSSYTPRPSINTKQNNTNLKGPAGFSGRKQEDEDILNRLLHLVQARKFDDLFGSLNNSPLFKQIIFIKVIQKNWFMSAEKEIELKEKVMKIMKDRGVKPTASSITPMISLYDKVGDTSKADALFEMMIDEGIKRNVTTYNSLMKCHANDTSKVNDLFARMIKDGIKPTVYTYATMIKAFSRDLVNVEKLYLEMIEGGIEPDVVIYNTMINLFAKNGKTVKAIEVFASMKKDEIKPDLYTYNTMIDAYSKSGQLEKAIEVFAS